SIKRLEKGFLNFEKDKINQAVAILGQLLFEETNKLRQSGRPEESLEGLTALSANETYPVVIRRQAAFTQAVVQLELGRGPASFEWLGKAIVLMDQEAKENTQEKKDPFGSALVQMNAMAEELFLSQDFKTSRSMSEAILNKMCKDKRSEKKIMREMLTRAVTVRLLEDNKTKELVDFGDKCDLGEKYLSQTKLDIYRHMLGLGDLEKSITEWTNHQSALSKIAGEKDLLIDLAKRRYWNPSEQSNAQKVLKKI